ncbi:MAG: ribosome biogenesis GTP-binding protein YihA/YsxC [Saprospiraceae bacterium]
MEGKQLQVHYLGSYKDVSQCPVIDLPEYCFIGRSNVGKSSIINLVTGQNEIARTSRKPGKTQSINLFKVSENPEWIIADLPGYGYAQVSKSTRGQWSALIDKYVLARENMMCAFLLLDIRHPRMENDREFMSYLGSKKVPFCILFTKSDKLKPLELTTALEVYKEEVLKEWEELPPFIITSSSTGLGRDEILKFIESINVKFIRQVL